MKMFWHPKRLYLFQKSGLILKYMVRWHTVTQPGNFFFHFYGTINVIIHMGCVILLTPVLAHVWVQIEETLCACELVKRHVPTEIREGYVILLESNNRHLHRLECDAVILISAWTNIIILEIFRSLSFETSFDTKKIKARISFSILMIETAFYIKMNAIFEVYCSNWNVT